MELFKIGFVPIRIIDVLDIAIVALLFYRIYESLRGSLAIRVTSVALGVIVMWRLVISLKFTLLGFIMDQFLGLGAIAVVIIFAPEIRKFLSSISSNTLFSRLKRQAGSDLETDATYLEVVEALKSLRAAGNGALIALTGSDPLTEIRESGDVLDAHISARLIFSIFQKESPLHDGAMILHKGRIAAVRCILPISKNPRLDPELGLRHRSGLGLSETSDALVIVVSEERRELSIAFQGELQRNVDYHDIEDAIHRHFQRTII
ncbi:MAG: diadenylate cyclase CdaA [Bacteroidia bacterium]